MTTPIFKCPLDKSKTNRLFNAVIVIGIVVFLLANLNVVRNGFNVRYWADDYCFSSILKQNGFYNGLIFFYSQLSNRYAAFILVALSEFFGFAAIKFLSLFFFSLTSFALFINISLLWKNLGLKKNVLCAFFLTQAFLFFLFYTAPNLFQSFYWRSGMVSYFAPLPFFLLLMSIFQQGFFCKYSRWDWVGVVILAFFATGTSETFAALQASAFIILLLTVLIFSTNQNKRQILAFLTLVIVSTLIGMVIMVKAPGNQLRLNNLEQATNLLQIISLSAKHAMDFIYFSFKGLPIPTILAFSIVFILSYHVSAHDAPKNLTNKIGIYIPISLLSLFLLVAAIAAPTAFGMLAYPEERAWMLGRFVMMVVIFLNAIVLGVMSHRILDRIIDTCLMSIIIIFILNLYPLRAVFINSNQYDVYHERAAQWDIRHQSILSQIQEGKRVIEIKAFDSIEGVYEITDDPDFWVNQCAADFYNIEQIIAKE